MSNGDTSRRAAMGAAALALAAGAAAAADLKTPVAARTARIKGGRFEGKVVLITGATSGIGKSAAHAFAAEGARVMFCGRRENLGAEVQAAIRAAGGDATYKRADVKVDADIAALVAACLAAYGGLDIAFNNAGIGRGGGFVGAAYDWKTHDDVIDTNLNGILRAMNHEIAALKARGGGAIINTASVLGYAGSSGTLSYGLSKAGVLSITRSAALQLAASNIRVNCVAPGPIDTPMMAGAAEASGKRTPSGRAGQPEEIARTVMFLASDEASYITGEDVRVDGGLRAS